MNIMFSNESKIELDIYIDEIEPEKNCNYIILGALFVPKNSKEEILAKMLNTRCQNTNYNKWHKNFNSCSYKSKCRQEWHNMNNCEVHFSDIRKGRKNRSMINISKSWLKLFSNNNKKIYSNVLFINLDNLKVSFFGYSSVKANIYNKFVRTLINYGLRCFFQTYDKIIINNIFYDEKTDLERHYFFNKSNLDKLAYESTKDIEFKNKIIFLKSDHKEEKEYPNESHFIQLIDLLIGSVRHNIFRTSESKLKDDVARTIRPLLNRLKGNRFDSINLKISFFPKKKIETVKDLNNKVTYERNDEFYYLDCFNFKLADQYRTLGEWVRD